MADHPSEWKAIVKGLSFVESAFDDSLVHNVEPSTNLHYYCNLCRPTKAFPSNKALASHMR
eukprot:2866532-Karenia_brevis.AAC.1